MRLEPPANPARQRLVPRLPTHEYSDWRLQVHGGRWSGIGTIGRIIQFLELVPCDRNLLVPHGWSVDSLLDPRSLGTEQVGCEVENLAIPPERLGAKGKWAFSKVRPVARRLCVTLSSCRDLLTSLEQGTVSTLPR